jgi:hypothetical protein
MNNLGQIGLGLRVMNRIRMANEHLGGCHRMGCNGISTRSLSFENPVRLSIE